LLEAFVFQQNLSSIDFGTLIASNQVSRTHFQFKSQKIFEAVIFFSPYFSEIFRVHFIIMNSGSIHELLKNE